MKEKLAEMTEKHFNRMDVKAQRAYLAIKILIRCDVCEKKCNTVKPVCEKD